MRPLMTLAVALLAGLSATQADDLKVQTGQRLSVAFRPLELERGERISAFELTVVQGHVQSVSAIPLDWSVFVNVDPSWKAVVSGGSLHGAGALVSAVDLPSLTLQVLDLSVGPPFGLTAKVDIDVEGSTTSEHSMFTRTLMPSDLIVSIVHGA
jgi:hypothetical protein